MTSEVLDPGPRSLKGVCRRRDLERPNAPPCGAHRARPLREADQPRQTVVEQPSGRGLVSTVARVRPPGVTLAVAGGGLRESALRLAGATRQGAR